ncbi:MAG TPA: glycosyltransferase family 4 protein [Nannocystis sp.]
MKILFLCHYFPPETNAPAIRTYENARRWVSAGHDVTVITSAPNAPRGELYPGYRNRLYQTEFIDGIRVVRVYTYLAANRGTWRRTLNYLSYMAAAFLAAQAESPDILVATSPQFFCGWAGVLLHWTRRWRFVLEIRDIWPESITAVGAMKQGPVIRLLAALERRMYAAADHIVTVGRGYRDNLLDKGVPTGKISVIYNGVDLERFRPAPRDPEFARKYGLLGKKVIGYIGTVGLAHGLDIVLAAAERCRDRPWIFLIVGDGARHDELRETACARGLHNIVFTGRLGRDDIPVAWAALDACLIHLRRSALFRTVIPSKMFEAMGMGIPILMGVEGEARDLVLAARAGLPVEPDDPDSLVRACDQLFAGDSPALASSAREFVARHFDRDILARDYLDLLQRLVR